jgi:hypothetical protein
LFTSENGFKSQKALWRSKNIGLKVKKPFKRRKADGRGVDPAIRPLFCRILAST